MAGLPVGGCVPHRRGDVLGDRPALALLDAEGRAGLQVRREGADAPARVLEAARACTIPA